MKHFNPLYLITSVTIFISSCSGNNGSKVSSLTGNYGRGDTDNTELVYITPYGGRFHCSNCFTIKGHEIDEISRNEAEEMVRTPCKKCHP